jgi:hypothetical protein
MSRKETKRQALQRRLSALEAQFKEKLRELESVGFMRLGSVQRRMMTCGKTNCACAVDPHARHGPYYTWTSKRNGKTISRLLSTTEGVLYERWVENRKCVERTLKDLYRISDKAASVILKLRDEETR